MTHASETPRAGLPILAILSVIIGVLIALTMVVAMFVGWRIGERAIPTLLLWAAVPASSIGLGLAVWSLVRRGIRRQMAHYGLWINGLIAVFGPPIAMAYSLVV